MSYARIYPSLWTGATGRRLRSEPAEVRLAAVWLLSNQHAHPTGVYYLPIPLMAHELGISPIEGASKALRSLSEAGFCHYDDATETVWIPEMAAHQIARTLASGDKRRAWMKAELDRIRKTPFYNDFLSRYSKPYNLGVEPEPVETKPLRSPFEAPSESHASPSDAIPHSAFRIPQSHSADTYTAAEFPLPPEPLTACAPTAHPTSAPPQGERRLDGNGPPTGAIDPLDTRRLIAKFPNASQVAPRKFHNALQDAVARLVAEGRFPDAKTAIAFVEGKIEAYAQSKDGRGRYAKTAANWITEGKYDDNPEAWDRPDPMTKNEAEIQKRLDRRYPEKPVDMSLLMADMGGHPQKRKDEP